MRHPIPDDARRPFRDSPVRRGYAELHCLLRTFIFHEENDDTRKAATIVLVCAWGAIEVGAAFGYATLPDQFFFLRIVVGVMIGRMWGIEINNFAGVEFGYTDGGENGGDDGDE